MLSLRALAPLSLLLAFGCIEAHDPPEPPPDPVCAADFEACDLLAEDACCEGYCADRGDGRGACMPRAIDGTPCAVADECQSGVCEETICGGPEDPECHPAGEPCVTNDDCCHGVVCLAGTCDVLREDGEDCDQDAQCRHGECNSSGFCGEEAPSCVPEGEECGRRFHGAPDAMPCCEGLECRLFFYGIATCGRPQPVGAPCSYPAECASGICGEGICRAAECSAAGVECTYDHQCCQGYCTGGAYVRGECVNRRATGLSCTDDRECHSRACRDGACL